MGITSQVRRLARRAQALRASARPGPPEAAPAPERPRTVVTDEQLGFWEEHGYLVLPGFFSGERVAAIVEEIDSLWQTRTSDDRGLVIDAFLGTPEGRRARFGETPDEARALPYKLNDVYLVSPTVREAILDHRLVEVLGDLLSGTPLVCNSLTFERGSQQPLHFDTFYMPPVVPNKMLASWIALEDIDDRAGPLRYFPRSHTIPPYHFSDGRLQAQEEEMHLFYEYIDKELADRGLSWETFPAKAGDVFIWHAQLYHGGAAIDDMSLTRKSLVTHYFRTEDMVGASIADIGGGRHYLRREHQEVDGT